MTDTDTTVDRKHDIYFATELVARRKELGWSRMQAAEASGLKYGTVAKLETGAQTTQVEYQALVAALGLIEVETVPEEGESIWSSLKSGDPVIIADDPGTVYEFRRYNAPEDRGGEYVEVVEIENRRVRRTRPVTPWKVCHYNGVGVDRSDEAHAMRVALQESQTARQDARREAWMQRQSNLSEVDV